MPDVWAIDGVEVPAAVARAVAYASSGGAEGVVEPEGLKVAPLDVPSTQVRVLPGAALVRNRYAGGSLQTYAVLEQIQQSLPVVATGSAGGRSDLVIVRVTDPEFGSGDAGSSFEIVQGVPGTAGSEYAATLGYPALALARIDIPASTATITDDMIVDLRSVAIPRTKRVVISKEITTPAGVESSSFTEWPDEGVMVEVPDWATTAVFRVETLAAHWGPNVSGELRIMFGGLGVVRQGYNLDLPAGQNVRVPMVCAGQASIPQAQGETRNLRLQARRTAGTGYIASRVDAYYILEVEFMEQAV